MKSLLTVWKKELLELARDRRTLALTLLFAPLLGPLMFMGLATIGESKAKEVRDRLCLGGRFWHFLIVPGFQMLCGPIESLIEVTKIACIWPASFQVINDARAADLMTANAFQNSIGGVWHVAVVAFAAG